MELFVISSFFKFHNFFTNNENNKAKIRMQDQITVHTTYFRIINSLRTVLQPHGNIIYQTTG